ncbi:uncharacterized protein BX664DRAFT_289527 [Halteromyces radiatus]|uniref:uncharacterized protein n=1 Tax=Halteromyces radiatus TaxID=101107 RepID=UPI00221EDAAD|nr:uncharacterized protein BX664DRAFT_289527 [Halteromyces radiatus]KAI8099427.1 hypothetical protein BX664DRAFT_289527 [Halteromyces radiatus]
MLRATRGVCHWKKASTFKLLQLPLPSSNHFIGRYKSTNVKINKLKTPNEHKYVSALVGDPENKLTPDEKRLLSSKEVIPKLYIGDYVEAFKHGQFSGIVVAQQAISGRQQRLTVLLRNGKTIDCRTSDVAFSISDFVSSPAVTQFLRTPVTINRQATQMDFIPTEYMRAIQSYQRTVKLEKGMGIRRLDKMYDHFINSSSSSSSSTTLEDLTRFAFDEKITTPIHRHATFLYLVANNIHFIPGANILKSGTWLLRSQDQVEPISQVIHWIRTRDTHYTDFLQKANTLVNFYRKNADEHTGIIAPDILSTINDKVQLTATDKMFINFMVDWIKMPKVIMESPHEVFGPAILKGLQCYDELFVDQSLAITFLKQIGMFRPWDNVGLVEEAASIRPFVWSTDAEKYDKTMNEYTNMFLDQDRQQWKKAGFYAKDPSDALRHDFGNLPVYTIDDPSAKEIDDGISVEHIPGTNNEKDKTWLHIHIADPTAYVPPHHTLASIMADRIQTLYLPERHFPMLPETLSSRTFSLGSTAQQVDKKGGQYAFTFSAVLNDQGQLSEWKVRPSLVRNVIKLHYDDVDAFFATKFPPNTNLDPLIDLTSTYSHPQQQLQEKEKEEATPQQDLSIAIQRDLMDIYHLTKQHSQQRVRNGAINFIRPNPVISLGSDSLDLPSLTFDDGYQYATALPPINLSLDQSAISASRTMVAEMMMMGGRIVSRYAHEHGIVLPFRTQQWGKHQQAARETMMANRDPETGMMRFQDLLQHMKDLPAAGLTTTSGQPHALMGITDGYCKATSPLRRYMDMIIHWQIKAHLLGQSLPFSRTALQHIGPKIELQEKQMSMLQQRSLQFWVLSLIQRLEYDSNMTWKCMIHEKCRPTTTALGGSMLAATATILELGIRARVEHLKDNVDIGDVLDVRVSSINPRLGMVNLVTV